MRNAQTAGQRIRVVIVAARRMRHAVPPHAACAPLKTAQLADQLRMIGKADLFAHERGQSLEVPRRGRHVRKAARKHTANHDPVFALIDANKGRTKEVTRLYNKLDEAEFEARKTHGARPLPLIAWR